MELSEILKKCDHTLLGQTATWSDIQAICNDGMKQSTASVCIPAAYVKAAKECCMPALGFSEHGNIFEWVHKKEAIEAAGMKYIHAAEVYLTSNKNGEDKHRDNYHCVLIAKNYD